MKLTHGIDLSNINRNEFNNLRLVKRILHNNEYEQYINIVNNKHAWIASRWAIKEAFFKATNNNLSYNKIQIIHINNKPFIKIDNQLLENIDISVSYENNLVIASVIYWSE